MILLSVLATYSVLPICNALSVSVKSSAPATRNVSRDIEAETILTARCQVRSPILTVSYVLYKLHKLYGL